MSSPSPSSPSSSPSSSSSSASSAIILWDVGWAKIYQSGILKVHKILEERGKSKTVSSISTSTSTSSSPSSSSLPLSLSFPNLEYSELYTTIYQMCIQKAPHCYTPQLYEKFDQVISDYLTKISLPNIQKHVDSPSDFLLEVSKRCEDFVLLKRWLGSFFIYLDRFYVKRSGKFPLADVAQKKFYFLIFEEIRGKLTANLMEWVTKQRNTTQNTRNNEREIDKEIIRQLIILYIQMGNTNAMLQTQAQSGSNYYQQNQNQNNTTQSSSSSSSSSSSQLTSTSIRYYRDWFERPLLKSTMEYYYRCATSWIREYSTVEYVRKVELTIQSEKILWKEIFPKESEGQLLEVLQSTLLMKYQKEILEKEHTGIKEMLRQKMTNDLLRVFQLYSQIPNHMITSAASVTPSSPLSPIAEIFHDHIMECGNKLIERFSAENNNNNSTVAASTSSSPTPSSSLATSSSSTSASSSSSTPSTSASSPSPSLSSGMDFIDHLLRLHDDFMSLCRVCFNGHHIFQKSVKDSFETLLNSDAFPTSMAELLATFSDNLLKKGGTLKTLTDRQLESTLDTLVKLFSYLSDKDIFSEFYRKHLASRLLLQRSASNDAEKLMIGKLKIVCGAQFTAKLEGMINDIRTSQEHSEQLQNFIKERNLQQTIKIEFTAQVLSMGSWPNYQLDDIKLHPTFTDCLQAFKIYYDSKTNNRKLTWIHDLGTVTLTANYPKRVVDIVLCTVQSHILLLFNERSSIPISQIISMTGLSPEVVKSQLKMLVNGKFKLLQKVPQEGYSETNTIDIYTQFVNPLRVIRIPNAIRKTTTKDRENATKNVSEDRKHAIEASIVRIMKSRKTLPHQQLMADVANQLMAYFQPEPKLIKQRIEDLINRDYLERDKEKTSIYHYLA